MLTQNQNAMTEITGYKPLEQAIMNGEKEVKVPSSKALLAYAVAEKCQADRSVVNKLIGMVMAAKGDRRQYNPETTYTLLSVKGKPYTQHVTLSTIADALHIMKILDALYVSISLQKDENGHLNGIVNFT